MANAKEIKNRISSVRDMQKITNAMYLIASTKMRKAKADLDKTRPYFDALRTEIKRIFRTVQDAESIYFYPPDADEKPLNGTYACLIITADKGLAGSYNQNVIKEALRRRALHEDTKFFVMGAYGRTYFNKHHIPFEEDFVFTAENPTMQRAREIAGILLEYFENGDFEKLFVIYTDRVLTAADPVICTRLLPFHRKQFADSTEKPVTKEFTFQPNVSDILNGIMPSYVSGYIYSAMVDSFCCEQNARMEAMNAANKNAEEILSDLKVQYNRVRQASITQEITEVSAGAKAQKRKRESV